MPGWWHTEPRCSGTELQADYILKCPWLYKIQTDVFSAPLLLESQSEYKGSLCVVYVRICTVTVVYVYALEVLYSYCICTVWSVVCTVTLYSPYLVIVKQLLTIFMHKETTLLFIRLTQVVTLYKDNRKYSVYLCTYVHHGNIAMFSLSRFWQVQEPLVA